MNSKNRALLELEAISAAKKAIKDATTQSEYMDAILALTNVFACLDEQNLIELLKE